MTYLCFLTNYYTGLHISCIIIALFYDIMCSCVIFVVVYFYCKFGKKVSCGGNEKKLVNRGTN